MKNFNKTESKKEKAKLMSDEAVKDVAGGNEIKKTFQSFYDDYNNHLYDKFSETETDNRGNVVREQTIYKF